MRGVRGYRRFMEEADRVLARLARIERLQPGEATAALLLDELRALVREAEDWARTEGDARAHRAVGELLGVVTEVGLPEVVPLHNGKLAHQAEIGVE